MSVLPLTAAHEPARAAVVLLTALSNVTVLPQAESRKLKTTVDLRAWNYLAVSASK
jgi:hypothetical protein